MKKNIIILFAFLIFGFAYSQVGINTENPKTSLDIRGKTDGAGKPINTDIAGVQAPRLTREQLTNKGNSLYGADQKGALVYITDVSGGNNQSQRIYIISPGYYYFDGLLWQRLFNLTGVAIFTAAIGNGNGAQTNATLSPDSFVTVPLTTVTTNVGGGVWNSSDYTYEIPFSGRYLISSSVRLTDNYRGGNVVITNNSPARNIFQSVDTANVDTPNGVWQISPDVNAFPHDPTLNKWYRYTMPYARIAYFNKGDKLRLYIYSDVQEAKISDAILSIASFSEN